MNLNLNESALFIEKLIRSCNDEIKVIVKFRDHQVALIESNLLSLKSTSAPGSIEITDKKLVLNTVDYKLQINVLHMDCYGYLSSDRFIELFDLSDSCAFEPNQPGNLQMKRIYQLYQDRHSIARFAN